MGKPSKNTVYNSVHRLPNPYERLPINLIYDFALPLSEHLPDSDLIHSLQDFAAEYMIATGKKSLESMDETALLGLGCLVTEWMNAMVSECLEEFEEKGEE
ncbi:RNA polymerase I upstream activation factor complex subunit Rrn10 [Schizosaccharomyces cryophilus OY26]|uniref:RNA polymerase I upstream activation factor complex subunit Rrn10 n=1 Tax=Schizosaccharomyces cryophilus (strain OY26 / ATCC MYA-4695 / CBS 11777 / NBRC 106824 / NRRL Y48691) TaxID=653667 RepID=S9W3T9_SCHCR|nr:RNA polymerase I upstream activation factor complex subunit Rrn10 [Schizosaccharomyces cryophilus OY26]EPY52610.1 RNA polymerase I upstream activation factor complex subunit Rrn10 [Schizosaccharomyces cryophilus OY26]